MKSSDKLAHMAAMSTFEEYYSLSDLAESVASRFATAKGNLLEVDSVCADGFTLRRKGDVQIGVDELADAISASIRDMLKDSDDAADYISDRFDLTLDEVLDTFHNLTKDIFEITRSGRLIFIEMDE